MKIKAKEKMVKVKTFVREHKKGLTIAGGMVLTGVVGYKVGNEKRFKRIYNDPVSAKMAIDIMNFEAIDSYMGIEDIGLKPSELGKLGESITRSGATEDLAFTHFVAFGEHKK